MRTALLLVVCLVHLTTPAPARADPGPAFEFRDGDRIVLLGDTLIERDQRYGYLETMVTALNPGKTITFRNLGWSGDTVRGLSRARFGPPSEGFQHLKEHVLALKPTVLIVGYGMADSFDGEAGLPRFVKGLSDLLDVCAGTGARIVMLSPIEHEDLGPPLPDASRHHASLRLYADAIEKMARSRGYPFVDLSRGVMTTASGHKTDDGIHLTALGYWSAALITLRDLCLPLPRWWVELGEKGVVIKHHGTRLEDIRLSARSVRFRASDERLPYPLLPIPWRERVVPGDRMLRIAGLDPGRYALRIDGQKVDLVKQDGRMVPAASAGEWAQGITLYKTPEHAQVERLRQAIHQKNLLYFHRWRPQNETYLFGFRKHEQGNNAREIPLFDPLVAEKEKEIAKLRVPTSHIYELTREGEVAQ